LNHELTPIDIADKHFRDYRIKNDEIVPVYCPFCQGGNSHDKYTFAVNKHSGTYNCKRGSCGATGSFHQLLRELGEVTHKAKNFEIKRPKVNYIPPTVKVEPATSKVEEYLKKRGFSKATWERRGVGEIDGNIAMPYYENGKLVLMKFRPPHKPQQGEKKGWREKGGKPVFWGMDLCTPSKPLLICEGEMDALALDECGISNVVSVPSGVEDLNCVDLCWDWLQTFRKIIIWVDNDEPGQGLQRKLINRLGAARCWVVKTERKDANEVLVYDGKQAVRDAVKNAVEVPISGLTRLGEVKAFDYDGTLRIKSGIRGVDTVMGGFMSGQFTIWTGVNSSGKSTLLGQVMLDSVDQGFSVCAYSGELPAPVFRYWIDLQAAGPNNLEYKFDDIKNAKVAHPTREALSKIRNWYMDKFFLCDSYGSVTDDSLFEVFGYAAQRYGCKVFMIDNLMTTVFAGNEKDFYRKQSDFVNKIAEFAQKYDVHVHLVAHPRKTHGRLTKMDVAGSGDITNRADNVLAVHRLTPKEKSEENCDTILEIFKNRFSGQQDVEIQLNFDSSCRRFGMPSDVGVKRFGWDEPTIYDAEQLFAAEV